MSFICYITRLDILNYLLVFVRAVFVALISEDQELKIRDFK